MDRTLENRKGSSPRTRNLIDLLRERGSSDRSGEWFSPEMFPDIAGTAKETSIITRRALAIKAMLEAATLPENSAKTHTYEIKKGELIVGVIPMGSVGLGKEFPRYLTEEESRVAGVSSRDVESVFGHNSPDYVRVLEKGLSGIIEFCQKRIEHLKVDREYTIGKCSGLGNKIDFYSAVETCCLSLCEYAERFASLAEKMAREESDQEWKQELLEVSRVCRKVPKEPADSFHEALQSIWFIHLALHSSLNLMSIGRLDQVLQPYLQKSIESGEIDMPGALELMECFLIKAAERLNLTSYYMEKQDHLDFGTGLGTNPIFLDQVASANNFLQNLVIGGQTSEGNDAVNDCTYLILEACTFIGLPTPTICARIHKNSPEEYLEKIASTLLDSGASLPIVYNDDVIIPAFVSSGLPIELARDYVVDGCWEPILNAKGDWTFGSINLLTILECALNRGALFSTNPSLLRGPKKSYSTPSTEELDTFDKLLDAVKVHLRFFTDQVILNTYRFYCIDGSVTPTPFFSSLLGGCLKKGIDKTWGGADYILGGVIASAVPNCANALAAIKQNVFDEKKCSLFDIVEALRHNFEDKKNPESNSKYLEIKKLLDSSPKFGNANPYVDNIMKWLMDEFHRAVKDGAQLAGYIFLEEPKNECEKNKIKSLRRLMGYTGNSLLEHFGRDFSILFTAGAGTFGQYAFMGQGLSASADGRKANTPIAPNFSPVSGTAVATGHILNSLEDLGLNRFAAGVIIDLGIDRSTTTLPLVVGILRKFVEKNGNIASINILGKEQLIEIYQACKDVREGKRSHTDLNQYNNVSVRVGGWNAPFITLTPLQQDDYMKRMVRA